MAEQTLDDAPTTAAHVSDTTPKPRYATPRTHLNWNKNDRLKVLKMLAWVLYDKEHIRNADRLEGRIMQVCEEVMYDVLREEDWTLDVIKEQTLAEQGAEITATKLLQRADKTERYSELNSYADAVLAAYHAAVIRDTYDDRRVPNC